LSFSLGKVDHTFYENWRHVLFRVATDPPQSPCLEAKIVIRALVRSRGCELPLAWLTNKGKLKGKKIAMSIDNNARQT
jgi:hypothetical protein